MLQLEKSPSSSEDPTWPKLKSTKILNEQPTAQREKTANQRKFKTVGLQTFIVTLCPARQRGVLQPASLLVLRLLLVHI